MTCYRLSLKSLNRLDGVHSDLVRVVARAIQITSIDFTVHEGVRTLTRQRELVARGTSWTMRSKHLTGRAVDLLPLPLDWKDHASFAMVSAAIKRAATELHVDLHWGVDLWGKDGPHYQLGDDIPETNSPTFVAYRSRR